MGTPFKIPNFKFGLDTRKDVLTSQEGTLVTLENAHITTGGEVEKRKQFDQAYNVSVFDADALAITITRSGSTATATLASHGLAVGDQVTIAGATQSEYNGIQTVTAVTTNTFEYAVSGTPATPATGSPTASFIGTFGLEITSEGLVVFGSAVVFGGTATLTNEPSLASALPAGITYKQLVHPAAVLDGIYNYRRHRMTKLVFSLNFNGTYFAAAQFTDGRIYLYYDTGSAIVSSYSGIILDSNSANLNINALADFMQAVEAFGWRTEEDLGISIADGRRAFVYSPAGDFFGMQNDWDSSAGQVGSFLVDVDGPGAVGTRASVAIQITTIGSVELLAPPAGSSSPTLNLTGGLVGSGTDAATVAAVTAQAVNDFSDYTGYQAVVSGTTVIIFAPVDFDLGTSDSPAIQLSTGSSTATIISATAASNQVYGFLSPTPLVVVREVPREGAAWPVSGEVALYVFGGTPPYEFLWSEMALGLGNGITIEDPDDPTTSFSKSIPQNSEVTGQFKCLIKAQSGTSTTVYLTVTLRAVYTSGQ